MHGLIAARIVRAARRLQDCEDNLDLRHDGRSNADDVLISGDSPMTMQPAEDHAVTPLTGQVLQLLQNAAS